MRKSNLKRIVVLFLSVLLAVGLTGCTAAPSNNPKGTDAGYTSGTLHRDRRRGAMAS